METGFKVQMLGAFVVEYGDKTVVPKESRDSKILQLFAYLLCNRDRIVPHGELAQAIIDEEDQKNPIGTLKNLVYRLRKLLASAGMERQCILSQKGGYGLDPEIPVWMDNEAFLSRAQELSLHRNDISEETLQKALETVKIYGGDLLPKAAGEIWVITLSVHYQRKYTECVSMLYKCAESLGAFAQVQAEIARAATLYPYEQSLYLMHISSLYRLGEPKKALAEYETIANRLLDDLGVEPSEQMQALYRMITGGLKEPATSPVEVRDKLAEENFERGAYCCNVKEFSSIYHFLVRYMERSGQSAFMLLCTMAEGDGAPPKTGELVSKMVEAFHKAVQLCTRRGDVFTRYSPSQFLLLLMDLKQEDCDLVAGRLRKRFYEQPKMSGTRLTVKSVTIANLDKFLGLQPKAWQT